MIPATCQARQLSCDVWPMLRLIHERVIALANNIDKTTLANYSSALNSYISFTTTHNFPIDPTPDTLSFFIVYMFHHIVTTLIPNEYRQSSKSSVLGVQVRGSKTTQNAYCLSVELV
jgi:hypothetical protein